MLPLAPPTFSTTTDWTSNVCIPAARTRPSTSVSPPGAKGTIIVIGRDGYVCALAIRQTAGSAAAPAARHRNFLRGNLMVMLQELEHLPNTFNHIQNPPQCPLLGVKRTLIGNAAMSAYDAVDGAHSAASKCQRVVA